MPRFTVALMTLLAFGAGTYACEKCAPPAKAAFTLPSSSKSKVDAETMKKYEETTQAVWKRLLKHVDLTPGKNWPKDLHTEVVFNVVEFVEGNDGRDYHNAVASPLIEDGKIVKKDGKVVPLVRITRGYLDVLGGDEHGIALVLGHELGHHALGHTTREEFAKPGAFKAMESHRREADADLFGARLMLKAGYSLRKGVKAEWMGLDARGWIGSPTASTCRSHPGASDRATRLFAVLDKGEAELWRCMSAFENGVTFLAVENADAAEECFLRVIKELPKCHEAWANLGIARLLRYCESLSTEEIRQLGIGSFLMSARYPTARSVVATRGNKSTTWFEAVAALTTAQNLKSDSPIIMANLSLAYLVHPDGKEVGKAFQWLTKAEASLKQTTDLPGPVRITLLVNFGVASLANGEVAKGKKSLADAETLATKLYGDRQAWPASLRSAMNFNNAKARVETDEEEAAALFEEYLAGTASSSPWWPIAYEHYEALCTNLGNKPKAKTAFKQAGSIRRQLVVALPAGGIIHVGESLDEVIKRLGQPDRITKARSGISRLRFEAHGIELLADADEVFAITIVSPKGPVVSVQEVGVKGRKLGQLKVGMTRKEVQGLIGAGSPRPFLFLYANTEYPAYYADLGVAVEFDKDGVVIGLIVGDIPQLPKETP